MPAPASSEVRDEAVRRMHAGEPQTEVSRQLGVSTRTLRRWAASVEPPLCGAPAAPASADVEPTEPDALDGDALDQARAMLRDSRALAKRASADSNHSAAQRAMRDASALAAIIARLEREQRRTDDLVSMPRAEITQALASVRERVAVLAAVPLTCPDCGRALRVAAVRGEGPGSDHR